MVFHAKGAVVAKLVVVRGPCSEPQGTFINIKTRSSSDSKIWSDWEQIINGKGQRRIPAGRYFEIEAIFESTSGETSPILYDLTIKPSPCCGDLDHPYPPGDVNEDCKVDFVDLTIMANQWLQCTAPDCD